MVANGEPTYSIAEFQDITERKRAEVLAAQARRRTAQLGLSAETIQTHVRRALRKLGARSRTHAVALALRLDLLEAPATPVG